MILEQRRGDTSEQDTSEQDTSDGRVAVAALRRFNRSFTQRIGVLDDSFLGTGHPLAEARLLFEIGLCDGATTLDLRRRLGLDSGYLSRLLRALESSESIVVRPDPADGRRRVVELTPVGRAEWIGLDDRSDQLASGLLGPLTTRQRTELHRSLDTARRLLEAASVRFEIVDPSDPAAVTAMSTYFAELDARFVGGFDPGDALTADAESMRAPAGAFVVARIDDDVVACGGIVRLDDDTAEIKRMWVGAAWRGLGLGARMLHELERRIRERGERRIVLDTNAVLTEAIAMYERHGYRPIERYNDNPYAQRWFAKELI